MKKTPVFTTDRLLSLMAIVVSLATFGIYFYQTHLIRVQQHAAVWPNLQVSPHVHLTKTEGNYQILIENSGVGPAIIEDAAIIYKGKEYPFSFWKFFSKTYPLGESSWELSSADLFKGKVIQPGKGMELVGSNQLTSARKLFDVFTAEPCPIKFKIKYRSIYDDHWVIDGIFDVAQPVEE
jgi:hypothetical protein